MLISTYSINQCTAVTVNYLTDRTSITINPTYKGQSFHLLYNGNFSEACVLKDSMILQSHDTEVNLNKTIICIKADLIFFSGINFWDSFRIAYLVLHNNILFKPFSFILQIYLAFSLSSEPGKFTTAFSISSYRLTIECMVGWFLSKFKGISLG